MWAALESADVPTLATHTHGRHRPHVSLLVADHIDPEPVLQATGRLPAREVPMRLESVGVFPGGVLFLACAPSRELLEEQDRVHEAARPFVLAKWPYYEPGRWMPHLTVAYDVGPEQLERALPLLVGMLPIHGVFDRGGVEDGATGESWPRAAAPLLRHGP
jgi:hypothetical protein